MIDIETQLAKQRALRLWWKQWRFKRLWCDMINDHAWQRCFKGERVCPHCGTRLVPK